MQTAELIRAVERAGGRLEPATHKQARDRLLTNAPGEAVVRRNEDVGGLEKLALAQTVEEPADLGVHAG